MNRFLCTPAGYAKLAADLKREKEVVRPQIVRDIEEARAHGDISENSEFEDAKERQSHCEARISMLEGQFASAEVVDVAILKPTSRVVFGTTVVISRVDTGEERRWRIVGENEADLEKGDLSYMSPLGKALVGRSVGDEVDVMTPGGKQSWSIDEVLYR
jgi:transcription elongation factor GreA